MKLNNHHQHLLLSYYSTQLVCHIVYSRWWATRHIWRFVVGFSGKYRLENNSKIFTDIDTFARVCVCAQPLMLFDPCLSYCWFPLCWCFLFSFVSAIAWLRLLVVVVEAHNDELSFWKFFHFFFVVFFLKFDRFSIRRWFASAPAPLMICDDLSPSIRCHFLFRNFSPSFYFFYFDSLNFPISATTTCLCVQPLVFVVAGAPLSKQNDAWQPIKLLFKIRSKHFTNKLLLAAGIYVDCMCVCVLFTAMSSIHRNDVLVITLKTADIFPLLCVQKRSKKQHKMCFCVSSPTRCLGKTTAISESIKRNDVHTRAKGRAKKGDCHTDNRIGSECMLKRRRKNLRKKQGKRALARSQTH